MKNPIIKFDIEAARRCSRDAIRCKREGDLLNAALWSIERHRYMGIARRRPVL